MYQAGVSSIEARPIDIVLTPPGGVAGAARAASKVGPAARIMKAYYGTETDEGAIESSVMAAFEGSLTEKRTGSRSGKRIFLRTVN